MIRRFLALAALVGASAIAPALANDSIGTVVPGQGEGAQIHVTSIRERKFIGIVRERLDFSCAAAVLATIFRDGYGAPVGEADIFRGMLNVSDPSVVRDRGFSLLDMKHYALAVGLGAEGFQIPLSSLADLKVPAIVLLDTRGYSHFAIVRHADDRYVYVADPALGNLTLTTQAFADQWNGTLLVVLGKGYDAGNILAQTAAPLQTRDLLLSAPVAPMPGFTSSMLFTGVAPVQRL